MRQARQNAVTAGRHAAGSGAGQRLQGGIPFETFSELVVRVTDNAVEFTGPRHTDTIRLCLTMISKNLFVLFAIIRKRWNKIKMNFIFDKSDNRLDGDFSMFKFIGFMSRGSVEVSIHTAPCCSVYCTEQWVVRELLPAAVVRLTEEDGTVEHHQVLTAVCTEAAILNTFGGWVLQPSVKDKQVCGTWKFSGGRVLGFRWTVLLAATASSARMKLQ